MPTRFRPYQPKQMLLLSPDLREWVPEGHLAHQVSELVDGLELGAFYRPYEEDGRRKAMSYGRMRERQLKEEIDQLLAKAQQQDGEEDERYGEDRRGDELPQELRRRENRLVGGRAQIRPPPINRGCYPQLGDRIKFIRRFPSARPHEPGKGLYQGLTKQEDRAFSEAELAGHATGVVLDRLPPG